MHLPTLDDIRAAAARVSPAVFRTPLVRLALDREVYAKAENLQRTGSFKLRGAYNFLASLPEDARALGVTTHSSGNHAQGVACAAHLLGVKATIVIPEGAPELKVERTRAWGAEIVRCENVSGAREETAEQLVREHGYTLVPPYDHPWIIAGQGTAGLEIVADLPDVANILVPVGGGGLIAGVASAVKALRPAAQVIGVEPELAADAQASFQAGKVQRWETEQTSRTIADGVRTQSVGNLNFAVIRSCVTGIMTVSDEEILKAARWYLQHGRLVSEPTGAITLAGYLRLLGGEANHHALNPGRTAILLSGGNIDPQLAGGLLSDTSG